MAIDYSPLFQTPESGMSKGMSFFSNVLDSVLQRRAQMEQTRMQIEAEKERQAAIDAREKQRIEADNAYRMAQEQRLSEKDQAQAKLNQAKAEREDAARRVGHHSRARHAEVLAALTPAEREGLLLGLAGLARVAEELHAPGGRHHHLHQDDPDGG